MTKEMVYFISTYVHVVAEILRNTAVLLLVSWKKYSEKF